MEASIKQVNMDPTDGTGDENKLNCCLYRYR